MKIISVVNGIELSFRIVDHEAYASWLTQLSNMSDEEASDFINNYTSTWAMNAVELAKSIAASGLDDRDFKINEDGTLKYPMIQAAKEEYYGTK